MSLNRYGAKRDGVENAIVAALKRAGAQVWKVSGKGKPDLLCLRRGVWYPLEVKSAKGRQTAAQVGTPWPIVRSELEAVRAIGAYPGSDL